MQEIQLAGNSITSMANMDLIIPQNAYSTGYRNYQHITAFYISDLHLGHHLDASKPLKMQIKAIVKELIYEKLIEMMSSWEHFFILFGGDVSVDPEVTRLFYHEFMLAWDKTLYKKWKESNRYSVPIVERDAREKFEREWKVRFPIFAVLGNHELYAFNTVNEAVEHYKKICTEEGICFLHNEFIKSSEFVNDDWDFNGYIVLGGTGFAKYNEEYNADTLIGAKCMSREDEIKESEEFYTAYQEALREATENNKLLVVIAHYPTKDWLTDEQLNSRCVYFTGHTHRNNSVHTERVNIYDNNQIGYHKKSIKFKHAILGTCYNPFIDYKDGTYEITPEQYMMFYDYNNDSLSGTGGIDRQLKTGVARLYMIKQKGFYGFFIINLKTGAKICVGGTVKNVSKVMHISYFSQSFSAMIEQFVTAMMPYRLYQEKIAAEVKELGFEGKIHGCIIDLDFYNHIMVNPVDGKCTYYYSPSFSWVIEHHTIVDLIESMDDYGMREIIEKKNNALLLLEQKQGNEGFLVTKSSEELTQLIKVDIKNSLYKVSARVAQLQRLFDSNILRDWDDKLAQKVVPDAGWYMPQKRVTSIKGQTACMRCGMECTVIEDKGYSDITVKFEDGTIVEHLSRDKFREKRIKNPNLIEMK